MYLLFASVVGLLHCSDREHLLSGWVRHWRVRLLLQLSITRANAGSECITKSGTVAFADCVTHIVTDDDPDGVTNVNADSGAVADAFGPTNLCADPGADSPSVALADRTAEPRANGAADGRSNCGPEFPSKHDAILSAIACTDNRTYARAELSSIRGAIAPSNESTNARAEPSSVRAANAAANNSSVARAYALADSRTLPVTDDTAFVCAYTTSFCELPRGRIYLPAQALGLWWGWLARRGILHLHVRFATYAT